ncbi:hypothetical protein D9Q98_003932 [Chlorella vulgaris]|uniref:Uncharacterized protein n=1 Tax=Chlorella vulgaris TaxID=3077 RepID=A0A9D4TRB5_CHLVU|nr:hypothetical protein D9Q98_003932 [Chlorella vulgaris]
MQYATDSFTLEFEVCNGFTNQRIALLSGLVLAAEANRSLVLPDFLLNGMQPDGIEMVTANQADTVPFGWIRLQPEGWTANADVLVPALLPQVRKKGVGPRLAIKHFDGHRWWQKPDEGRDNCVNNTDSVGDILQLLVENKPSALVQPGEELTREESALVDYYLGLDADKFTGNSVSTFTAFMILERQWLGRHSTHYNGGNVPLHVLFTFYGSGLD